MQSMSRSDTFVLDGTVKRVQNESMKNDATDKNSGRKCFPKTDSRYWRDKVFQRTNDEFHVRMRFGGTQYRWPPQDGES